LRQKEINERLDTRRWEKTKYVGRVGKAMELEEIERGAGKVTQTKMERDNKNNVGKKG